MSCTKILKILPCKNFMGCKNREMHKEKDQSIEDFAKGSG